jgi:hypothetical protein
VNEAGGTRRTPVPNNDLRAIGILREPQEILGIFPMPNGYVNPSNPKDLRNYVTSSLGGQRKHQLDMRFDYRITPNDNIYAVVSYHHQTARSLGGLIPELNSQNPGRRKVVTVNYARVFGSSITNEFIVGVARGTSESTDEVLRNEFSKTDTLRNKFFKNIGTGINKGFHRITLSGNNWTSIGRNEVFWSRDLTVQFADNFNVVKGGHSLKFGGNYLTKNQHDTDYMREVTFDSTFTRAGSLDGQRGGDAVATFLLGVPSYILQPYTFPSSERPDMNYSAPYWGAFVDDKWQVTPKLTLSLGLRYDLSIVTYSPMNYGNAKMDFTYPGWQLKIPGRAPGVPQHFVPADKNNFAPRISLAYQAAGGFVARASYGIFYMAGSSATMGNIIDYVNASVPGYIGSEYTNGRFNIHDDIPYLKLTDIFPPEQSSALDLYPVSTGKGSGYFDYPIDLVMYEEKSGTVAYYQRYMAQVEKGLGPSTLVSLSFLGGRGTKLPYLENINIPPYRTGWSSTDVYNSARPNSTGRFADLKLIRHGMNTFYNSATVKLQRNLSRGLQFITHYTFSKTVADSGILMPGGFGTQFLDFGGYAETVEMWDWNRKLGRGEVSYSHPHRFVLALSYNTPWGRSLPSIAKALLWGWTGSAVTTFESGNTFTPRNGVTSARDYEPAMANVSSNPNLSRGERGFSRYFNQGVFSAPPLDVKGNAGVGILRGPGVNNWDVSFAKTFRPKERLDVALRGELLNAFNHTQWSNINSTFSDAAGNTFGWVTGARPGRVVQLILRVSF